MLKTYFSYSPNKIIEKYLIQFVIEDLKKMIPSKGIRLYHRSDENHDEKRKFEKIKKLIRTRITLNKMEKVLSTVFPSRISKNITKYVGKNDQDSLRQDSIDQDCLGRKKESAVFFGRMDLFEGSYGSDKDSTK